MKRKKPMLVITLQIPLTEDLTTEDVLEGLREQTETALQMVRDQIQAQDGVSAREHESAAKGVPSVAMAGLETLESFSDQTKENILDQLGYRPAD